MTTTEPTFTFTLTGEQAEDMFDALNVAGLYYIKKVDEVTRDIECSHDWRVASIDKLKACEDRRDLFSKRWVEFYQQMKKVRAAQGWVQK
jgi:hypothetical protein